MKNYLIILIIIIACIIIVIFIPTSPPKNINSHIHEQLEIHSSELKDAKYSIVIDYSKPIFVKRLWIIELQSMKVISNYHISHARNSGIIYASRFSNKIGSNLSCKGNFKTLNTYKSQYGKGIYQIGMRLKGLDAGINDNTFERNIVFHTSYSPWSSGCFMTFPKINKKIVELTKEGNLLIVI